jgi:CBS domain-containing protein
MRHHPSPPSPAAALVDPVAGAMEPPPPILRPETPLAEALAAMTAGQVSVILAADAAGRPVGILTERDAVRRVAFRLPPTAPLADAMSSPVIACPLDAGLWRGAVLLRAGRLRHLPVVDGQGRCVGMLHRDGILAALSGRLLTHLDALAGDDAAVKGAQAGVAAALLAEGVPAREVVGLVSAVNVDLHRRVLDRAIAAHGPPPVPFTLLLMGSAGRGESLLRPDQDNGFIIADHPAGQADAIDGWFHAFAETFNLGLAAAGFPLCPGGIMARNRPWRGSLAEWQRRFEGWADRRAGDALLFADIVFDFRAITGDPAPAAALRTHLGRVLAARPALLSAIAAQNASLTVGLTLFGGFSDDEPGPGRRTDLKLHGLMPLVAATRLLALRDGVTQTGTLARIAALVTRGSLAARDAEDLRDAFEQLLDAVLRQQLADHEAGRDPGSLVDTTAMARPDRDALRDALKAVRSFSRGTFGSFTGTLW